MWNLGLLERLPTELRAVVVSHVQQNKQAFKNAREACSSLRDIMDDGLRRVDITLNVSSEPRAPGSLPLHRWVNCQSISITVCGNQKFDDEAALRAGSMLALLSSHLSAEACQTITQLDITKECCVPASAVALILSRLPKLQRVSLVNWEWDFEDPTELHVLASALASLPELIDLTFHPNAAFASLVQHVGGRLQRLHISVSHPAEEAVANLRALVNLPRLKHLTISGTSGAYETFCNILRSLPTTLESLELHDSGWLGYESDSDWYLSLDSNRLVSMTMARGSVRSGDLATMMRKVYEALLPSGSRVENVDLATVTVRTDINVDDEPWHHDWDERPKTLEAGLRQLQALFERCEKRSVEAVRLEGGLPPNQAEAALALLATPKTALELGFRGSRDSVIRLGLDGPAQAAGSSGAAASQPTASNAEAPSLLSLAQRVIVNGTAAADGGSSGGGSSGGGFSSSSGASRDCVMLLLRGPQLLEPVRQAASGDGHPLKTWVQQLLDKAKKAAKRKVTGVSYLSLPLEAGASSGSMLLQSFGSEAAAALIAAARKLAAAGVGTGRKRKAATGASDPPTLAALWAARTVPSVSTRAAFGYALQQAAQSVWDGEGFSAEWTQRQRLRWLLEQWALMPDFPPERHYRPGL